MTSLGLAAFLQLAVVSAGGETYAEAHKESVEGGRPLMVLVGADWCPACNVMKNTVIPQVRQRGALRRVAFALVNFDQERDLASKLTQNGPIPQLFLFRRTKEGWEKQRLVGGQDAQTVEQMILDATAVDQAGKPASGNESGVVKGGTGQPATADNGKTGEHG